MEHQTRRPGPLQTRSLLLAAQLPEWSGTPNCTMPLCAGDHLFPPVLALILPVAASRVLTFQSGIESTDGVHVWAMRRRVMHSSYTCRSAWACLPTYLRVRARIRECMPKARRHDAETMHSHACVCTCGHVFTVYLHVSVRASGEA
jgi:hypothetical protein